jgi:TPR repeat protein
MLRRILAGVFLALILAGAAWDFWWRTDTGTTTHTPDPLREAEDAYSRNDFATAVRLLRPLAEQGNAQAASLLGMLYDFGWGVPKDYTEEAKWVRRAAEQGDTQNQLVLGDMYDDG